MAEAVKANDQTRLESQIAVSDSLYRRYKTFYPRDFAAIGVSVSISSAPKNVYHLTLFSQTESSVFGSSLGVVFTFDDKNFKEEYRKQYREKYESIIQQVAYWFFTQSDLADNTYNVIFIVDDEVAKEPHLGNENREIKLKESDLTPNKMISLLKQLEN